MAIKDCPNVGGHCVACDVDIGVIGARYCPLCGEQLKPIFPASEQPMNTSKTTDSGRAVGTGHGAGTCMVCKKTILPQQSILWCPFCGRPAHDKEFTKWVNKNSSCPSCKKELSSDAFSNRIAFELREQGITGEQMWVKPIRHRNHLVKVELSQERMLMKIFYDGRRIAVNSVNAGPQWLSFDAVENAKLARYFLQLETYSHKPNRYYSICLIRNGKFVYNDGILISPHSQVMRGILEDLKSRGIEPDQKVENCPHCGVEMTIMDPSFCPCCGASLEANSNISADRGNNNPQSSLCFICNTSLTEDAKKGQSLTWCPFCGRAAHTNCFVKSLEQDHVCPSCHSTFQSGAMTDQLKECKHKRKN